MYEGFDWVGQECAITLANSRRFADYITGTWAVTGGRDSGYGISVKGVPVYDPSLFVRALKPGKAYVTCGFSVKFSGATASPAYLAMFSESIGAVSSIGSTVGIARNGGELALYAPGAIPEFTSGLNLQVDTWYNLQASFCFSQGSTAAQMYLNGILISSITGWAMDWGLAGAVAFGSAVGDATQNDYIYYDDLYVKSGDSLQSRLGDVKVGVVWPTTEVMFSGALVGADDLVDALTGVSLTGTKYVGCANSESCILKFTPPAESVLGNNMSVHVKAATTSNTEISAVVLDASYQMQGAVVSEASLPGGEVINVTLPDNMYSATDSTLMYAVASGGV